MAKKKTVAPKTVRRKDAPYLPPPKRGRIKDTPGMEAARVRRRAILDRTAAIRIVLDFEGHRADMSDLDHLPVSIGAYRTRRNSQVIGSYADEVDDARPVVPPPRAPMAPPVEVVKGISKLDAMLAAPAPTSRAAKWLDVKRRQKRAAAGTRSTEPPP